MSLLYYTDIQDKQKWVRGEDSFGDPNYYARSLYGRTAGMLGYGALGRETARLLKAHGMRVVAANTSGKAGSDPEVRRKPRCILIAVRVPWYWRR